MNAKELEKLLAEVTPGEWRVEIDESAAQVSGFPCIEADGYTVVGSEGMYGDIETDFSNARLIAMAPTLALRVIAAEKLAEALRWIKLGPSFEETAQETVLSMMEQASAALAEWEAAQ